MGGIGPGQVSRDFGGKCSYNGESVEIKGKIIHSAGLIVTKIMEQFTRLGDWIESQGDPQMVLDFDSLVALPRAQLKVDIPGRGRFATFTVTVENDGPNVKEKFSALYNLAQRNAPVMIKIAEMPDISAGRDDGSEEESGDDSNEATTE